MSVRIRQVHAQTAVCLYSELVQEPRRSVLGEHAFIQGFIQLSELAFRCSCLLDYAFNIVNRETIAFLERYPFSSLMISPETDGRFPKGSKCALEYIGYGRTPLMYTRTCVIRNLQECARKEQCFAVLTDRTGAKFPIISAPNHTNTIYNAVI